MNDEKLLGLALALEDNYHAYDAYSTAVKMMIKEGSFGAAMKTLKEGQELIVGRRQPAFELIEYIKANIDQSVIVPDPGA